MDTKTTETRAPAQQVTHLLLCEAILDALPDRIAAIDERGAIVAANSAWRRSFIPESIGLLPDPIGCRYDDGCRASAIGPADEHADALVAEVERILGGELKAFTYEYPCKSGTGRWYRVEVTPVMQAGVTIVIRHQDITESREAEARRQARLQARP